MIGLFRSKGELAQVPLSAAQEIEPFGTRVCQVHHFLKSSSFSLARPV
jgi:hypothetical protein